MRPLSSNIRARAGELYRLGSVHDIRFTPGCEHTTETEHINDHKADFYGMVAQLSNGALRRTLELRGERGKYGLMDSSCRPVHTIGSARSLHRILASTMQCDTESIRIENPELVQMIDEYLEHLRPTDRTLHSDSSGMLNGGVYTAVEAIQNTYEVLTSDKFGLSEDEVLRSWQTVLGQAKLGVKQFLALPGIYHTMSEREEMFALDDQGLATFCAHAIRIPAKLDYIVDRETIGCPITFEPGLLRELWQWYVGLRSDIG